MLLLLSVDEWLRRTAEGGEGTIVIMVLPFRCSRSMMPLISESSARREEKKEGDVRRYDEGM